MTKNPARGITGRSAPWARAGRARSCRGAAPARIPFTEPTLCAGIVQAIAPPRLHIDNGLSPRYAHASINHVVINRPYGPRIDEVESRRSRNFQTRDIKVLDIAVIRIEDPLQRISQRFNHVVEVYR